MKCEYIFIISRQFNVLRVNIFIPYNRLLCCVLYFFIQQMISFIVPKFSWCCDRSICCGNKFYFKIEIQKHKLHIYCVGRVYFYIWFIWRIMCDILVALVLIFIKFYKFVWQVFLFKFSVLVIECVVVLIGVIVRSLVQWICGIICLKICYESLVCFSAVNSLWPSDIIWRQGSRSTLAQVMACCLTAPSHYLDQCWLMINEVL